MSSWWPRCAWLFTTADDGPGVWRVCHRRLFHRGRHKGPAVRNPRIERRGRDAGDEQ